MNKYFAYIIFALFFSCSGSEQKPTSPQKDSVNTETTNTIPVNTEYRYEVTDLKTGEVMDLSQEEYLHGNYIDNPDYSVTEHVLAK